ncbi:MAG: hypothetical protein O3C23_01625 [bacterium]|nr:hypothetical protein [bacterium]
MVKNILIGVGIVIIIVAGLYYFLVAQKQAPTVTPIEKEEKGLGGELFEKTANPAQKVPETNPFKEVETNPLQGTNPFEGTKNPFE